MAPVMFSRHPFVATVLLALLGIPLGLADRSLSRAQVGYSLTGTFIDVPFSHPASTAIEYLAQKGIVSGYPDGTFQPDQEINRAEFTKIVMGARFLPLDIEGCLLAVPRELLFAPTLLFSDVALHQWFAKYVCRAKVAGIITGYPDGTFRPAANVNFVEAAKILANGFSLPLESSPTDDPWYHPYVEALASRSAIPFSISSFEKSMSRGEMAEMMYRLHADIRDLPSLTSELLPPSSTTLPSENTPSPFQPPSFPSFPFDPQTFFSSEPPPSPPPTVALPGIPYPSPTSIEYSKRIVTASGGRTYTIDLITADLDKGVRIHTVAANEHNCDSECPASPLADFVQRLSGVAGINGTYFCPPEQLYCVGQKNSFFSFLFNSLSRTFINEEKRTLPAAGSLFVFRPGSITFLQRPTDFPLDENITGALASWPTLLVNGKKALDPLSIEERQRAVSGNRGAIGNRGNMLYLISAQGITIPDLVPLVQALELDNAVNLDGEGSSALYYHGKYKVGPGRPIPNAVVVVP